MEREPRKPRLSPAQVCEIMDKLGETAMGLSFRLRITHQAVRAWKRKGASGTAAALLEELILYREVCAELAAVSERYRWLERLTLKKSGE